MPATSPWLAVKDLGLRLLEEMDWLAVEFTARIRSEVPGYELVPLAEHESHVREQQERIVKAVIDRRRPSTDDLRGAELLGRRRAGQGVPVHAVISAYHVGNRELWNRMCADPGPALEMLPDVAALMWATIQVVTAALAEAHSEVTRALQADQITLRHRLVTLLQAGVTDEETAQIASALRFDPYGDFIAVSSSAVATPDSDGLAALRTRLDALPGTAICAHNGATVVILSQRNKVPALTAAIRRVRPDSSLAIGLRRPAIGGAAASLRDSQRVLATIEQARSVSRFEDHWLHAILLASADELSSLVESKLSVVRTNPHLVEAVRAFAEHDLSATGAARAMDLHPNTTMYRLARWQNLTGWDPRTFRGLTLSLLATWISGAEACEETDD